MVVRRGACVRCGDCCKTGDPFAQRIPRTARQQPCSYYREHDGVGDCTARRLVNPPAEVASYLANACTPFPERPECLHGLTRCGYSFELEHGD